MKRLSVILLIAALLLCLGGCADTPDATQPVTEPTTVPTTEPAPTEPAVYVQPDLPKTGDESRQLTAEELAVFAELFDPSGDVTRWYNRAITSRYSSAADLNILYFVYSSPMEEVTTDDEAFYGNTFDCLHKYSISLMDENLMLCFGITLAETNGIGLDEMVYNEAAQCYYHDHGDVVGYIPSFYDGYVHPDGTVELYYNGFCNVDVPDGLPTVVTLKYVGENGVNHWHILSNVVAE